MNKLPALFDANGSFGSSSAERPAFPGPKDLLAHLDRLGVERALVWNTEARQGNCPEANRRLLSQIGRSPVARRRLVPAFTISPTMVYEHGAVEGLRKAVNAAGVAALRLPTAVTGAHSLRQTEPILDALSSRRPVVLVNNNDADGPDLLALAQRLPSVCFILTDVMWPRYVFVFDLMRRCPNVLVETSWLHTTGAIELIIKEFGADRAVFGLGERSHNGASIAALAHAQVSDDERDMIAHGNLDRLLGLKPAPTVLPSRARRARHTLWSRMLQGKKLGVDIIDAHVHLGPSGSYLLEEQSVAGQVRMTLRSARALGIATMLVSGMEALAGDPVAGNRSLERQLGPHGRRFRGYLGFNPHYEKELARRLDAFFARGFFVGFKTLCDYWRVPITDARFAPMLKYANDHRLPILNHTWTGSLDSPAMLTDIVREYPDAVFLLGHSGGTDAGRRQAEELAANNDNVYLEWCGSFCSSIPWEETLARVGADKVVFGSDSVYHDVYWELGRLLSLGVPDATLRPILGDNMRQILARRRA